MCRSSERMYLVPQTPRQDEKDATVLQQMPGVTCICHGDADRTQKNLKMLLFVLLFDVCWNQVQNSSWTLPGIDFLPGGSTIKRTFWTCAVAGLLFQPWKFCRRSACVRTAGPLLLKDACCMCIFIPKTPSAHELVKGLSRRQEHGGVETWRHSNPTPAASGKVGFG